MTPFETATGVVQEFDDPRGLGVIRTATGEDLPFHCTAITDGTRTIPVGERVRFTITPGPQGRWQATQIHPG
jgi:cold shock CspA family protein